MPYERNVIALAEFRAPLLDEDREVPAEVLAAGPQSFTRWVAEQLAAAGVTVRGLVRDSASHRP